MIYKNFQNLKLSALGLGTMRLPVVDGNDAMIDENAAGEMIDYAVKNGVNYFDTAWGYHGENSETVVGKILKRYPRDSFYLASKFPGYDLANMDKVETIFEKQLEKCQVEHFDYYMFHNVCEMNIKQYLDPKFGIFDYLKKQKDNGRIRHLGFSVHGSYEVMKEFMDAYGAHMEFCQVQLNYVDWSFQNAKAKVEILTERNIPIIVMEPMRGGSLAKLSEDDSAKLKSLRPDEEISAWAFRYLQTFSNVAVILSGASNLEQLKQNIKVFESEKPLTEQERDALQNIADDMVKKIAVPCTSCGYCLEHCPQKLNIPSLIELYNEHCYTVDTGLFAFIAPMALMAMPQEKQPMSCSKCENCESVCPQQIKISKVMSDFAAKMKG